MRPQNLAYFVRTHERALANALQLQRQRTRHGQQQQTTAGASSASSSAASSTTITLADALSRPYLSFSSSKIKPAKLTLTPHHLYYLLTKFDDLGVDVGPMNVRLENLHADAAPSNYVSFLGHAPKSRGKQSDADSLRSVSSVRSAMSSMSSMWSALTLGNSAAKAEKQMAQHKDDIKYLYSCFTKIPALRLSPDHRARLVSGFEEFPFDTAVPIFVFKNLSALEICDLDFRQFFGWDRLADQVRSLTVKRAHVEDPLDLLLNIVLDDMDKRRRRSSKALVPTTPSTPGAPWPSASPKVKYAELSRSISSPNSPLLEQRRGSVGFSASPQHATLARAGTTDGRTTPKTRQRSVSPSRPISSRQGSTYKPNRTSTHKLRRSSGSSGSSAGEMTPRRSTSDLLNIGMLPASKWRFLRHLSLAENSLTYLTTAGLAPIANTLQSLDLSGNLFSEVPDALASLTHLRALNLSNCMIESLQSLSRSPLPAITTLNLRSNRLLSLAGIERLFSLERLDIRDNRLHDPTELARLTGIPDVVDLYVVRNPFTRSHSNYRVTILNLFRSTPGHMQDVTIDTLGPTYNEKKQLVERVPEPANRPIVKPPPEDESPPLRSETIEHPILPPPMQQQHETFASPPGHRRTTSDFGPRSSIRRKKGTRRRIVELTHSDLASPTKTEAAEQVPPAMTAMPPKPIDESDEPVTPDATLYHTAPTTQVQCFTSPQRPTLETAFASPTPAPRIRSETSDDDDSPVRSPQEFDSHTDLYRQKIEALKSELGPNWLTALNDDRLNEQRSRNRSFSPASRTSTVRPENPGRGVSVGGRTLG